MKTKTATVIIYPVRGTVTGVSALIEYKGKTEWNYSGYDTLRATMLANAKNMAKNMGFTHVKVWHEYSEGEPMDMGKQKL